MTRAHVALLLVVTTVVTLGCGTYGITYDFPSRMAPPERTVEVEKNHAHGVGPFLLGGGGFFFLFQAMSPAMIDYTGEVDLEMICPGGEATLYEVRHYHHFGHNSLAALISWLAFVNWYHPSRVVYECVAPAVPAAG